MKQYMRSALIVVVVLALAAVIFMILESSDVSQSNLGIDGKAESVGIGEIALMLRECQGYSEAKIQEDRHKDCSYDISDEDLQSLEALQDLKGIMICGDDRISLEKCVIESYYDYNSDTIWQFFWSEGANTQSFHTVTIWKNGKEYYCGIAKAPNPKTRIYRIEKPDKEILDIL